MTPPTLYVMVGLEMRAHDLDRFRRLFDVPDHEELTTRRIDPPPGSHSTWASWAAERWPTSMA